MTLYDKYAQAFSLTRQSAWNGWLKLEEKHRISKYKSCLDLGCGNGRFFEFLGEIGAKLETYTGIDISTEMLKIARTKIPDNHDLINQSVGAHGWSEDVAGEFELIVAFGLMHHLLDEEDRKSFFQGVKDLASSKHILCLTFWQFISDEREKKKVIRELDGENNFELKFGENATRQCHFYSPDEAKHLVEQNGLNIIDTFFADGKSNLLNFYIVCSYV